jgi:MoaA/NifB/PqqE/SkfB family radical SAM enzyme
MNPETSPPVTYPADWRITSRCTLACDFCYGPVPGNDPTQLRTRIFDSLRNSSADIITFCGGEPLLVREVGTYAAELQRTGKQTVLNTNGSLLSRRIAEGMQMAFDIVGLSLDGSTEHIHREMRGKRADFAAVLDAVHVVRAYPDIRLKIATVVSRVNRDDLQALATLVRDIRPDVWRLYQYSEIGDYNRGQVRHSISKDEFEHIVRLVSDKVGPTQVYASSAEQQGPGCLIVSMDGTVFPAGSERDVIHGNCLETPLDQIWNSIPTTHEISVNKRWHNILGEPLQVHVV